MVMRKFGLYFLMLIAAPIAYAGGGATGGSTEFTQVMNNGELVATVQNTAEMIASANKQLTEIRQQVKDSATNLTSLPKEVSWIKDVASTATESYRLYSTIESTRREFTGANNWLERRVRSYQCTPTQRIDSCLRKVSQNVEKQKSNRIDRAKYFEESIQASQSNVDKMQDIIARGRTEGTGNKEQLNLLQEQSGVLAATLAKIHETTVDQATQQELKDVAKEDAVTRAQIANAQIYKRKMDMLNDYRKASGLPPIDTSNNVQYNMDTDELNAKINQDIPAE